MPRLSRALTQILFARPLRLSPLPSSFPALPLSAITQLSPSSRHLLHPFSISPSPTPALWSSFLQIRAIQRGAEYQPSQRKRKRKHGFLARKRSLGGRKILRRRMAKGRRYPSH